MSDKNLLSTAQLAVLATIFPRLETVNLDNQDVLLMIDTDAQNVKSNTTLVLTINVSEENLDVFTQMEFALTVLLPSKKPPMVFVLFKDVFNSWVMDVKHAKALMSLFQVDAHILTVFKCQVESV